MALKTIATRSSFFFFSNSRNPSFPLSIRPLFHSPIQSQPCSSPSSAARTPLIPYPLFSPARKTFCTSPETPPPKKRNPKLTNFSLPSDSDSRFPKPPPRKQQTSQSPLPPPYNPFSKKPAIEEPEDPKNLQEVFAKIREDGLMNSAVKMFDGLSQDGLTHEALELFSQIKDKGQMPDVVAHTAVMEAYANAGQAKEAHKVYLRMLSSGVTPNAYTYRVVIGVLAGSGDEKMTRMANKYVGEMVGRGMRPNAGTCVGVLEGMVRVGLEDEGSEMVEMLKEKGAMPQETKVRELLKGKGGTLYPTLITLLYGK
ncbi:pentatricopeptide repeat-containing protein at4g38150 [Phtheirospermum japonicum]|uniref:Pentatricopeptide repeat-containing protein at4g38150 n=1 Tax=Phtheirospermum japonicum TaxID=374723 RepID=A0A830CFB9_9LAMI|nr:pentatricopeptide repeat-containing protein at4g38150 [Phtheirospermum japonicum]